MTWIPGGTAGVRHTLYAMVGMIQQDGWAMRRPSLQVPAPRDIDTYLRERWVYVPDGVNEVVRPALLNIDNWIGDCDDAAVVAGAFLFAHGGGIHAWLESVRFPENQEFSHVYVIARDAGGEFRIDPTAPIDADYSQCEKITVRIF